MDLHDKIRTHPTQPGVYLYKNADGRIIYVGKAINLRARVRSYFSEAAQSNAKTGSLMRQAVDIEYIQVANEVEALALENNLIKRHQPRFNVLLRDDKGYPYIQITIRDRYPKVLVTRRMVKDGSLYFGPYIPSSTAWRLAELVHRHFLLPGCKVDLSKYHDRACLQYHIHRCLGPCVKGLTTPDAYSQAVADTRLFLEGRTAELEESLHARMAEASQREQYELAAKLRDFLATIQQIKQKMRVDGAGGVDSDILGFHFANSMLAINLFHMREGKIVDRREFFFENLPELPAAISPDCHSERSEESHRADAATDDSGSFDAAAFFASFLSQLYLDRPFVPPSILIPVDLPEADTLAHVLSEQSKRKVEILVPRRGEKRSLVDLACQNARLSFDQRFRVLQPSTESIQSALQQALMLPDLPERIECFDISHIQGAEPVASLVVWQKGQLLKSDYRKFQIKSASGQDDFAAMQEVVTRRYTRLLEEGKPLPSLILIDGGLGQLHAAAAALDSLGIPLQPLASIAKKEEIIYVQGQDEPIVLDRRSPVLHLIQRIRDESHRFAIAYHRKRRQMRDRPTDLLRVPGVGPRTSARLVEHFGSIRGVSQAGVDALSAVVNPALAAKIRQHFIAEAAAESSQN